MRGPDGRRVGRAVDGPDAKGGYQSTPFGGALRLRPASSRPRVATSRAGRRLADEAMKVVHPEQGCKAGDANPTSLQPEPRMNVHKCAHDGRWSSPSDPSGGERRLAGRRGSRFGRHFGANGLQMAGPLSDGRRRGAVRPQADARPLAAPAAAGVGCGHRRASKAAHERSRHRPPVRSDPLHHRRRAAPPRPRPPVGPRPAAAGGPLPAPAARRVPPHRYQEARIAGIGHRITGHHAGMHRSRGIGWEHLHVAIDDASRLAYTELLPDETNASACSPN